MAILEFKGDYRFLSNFWPAEVVLGGETYPTVENAYQAAKTEDIRRRGYLRICTPGQAKRHAPPKPDDWEKRSLGVMESLVLQKFQRHPELLKKLLETGVEEIYEGNTWGDTFWGVDVRTKVGENNLGKIIMQVREAARLTGL